MKKLMLSSALILVGLQPVSASDVEKQALENSIPLATQYVAIKEQEACGIVEKLEKDMATLKEQGGEGIGFQQKLGQWKPLCEKIKGQLKTLQAGGSEAINLIKNTPNKDIQTIVAMEKAKLENAAVDPFDLGGPL